MVDMVMVAEAAVAKAEEAVMVEAAVVAGADVIIMIIRTSPIMNGMQARPHLVTAIQRHLCRPWVAMSRRT